MFKIFRKKNLSEQEHPQVEKAAAFFARSIIKTQTRMSNWLSKYEQRMTTTQKKYALLVFCIGMNSIAVSLLYRGIVSNHDHTPGWLKQNSITMPETYPLPDSLDINSLRNLKEKERNDLKKTDSIHN